MHELALFAGAGGGILGGKLLGWKTVCAVEIDDYARRVLMARQDDGSLPPFPIWDDIRTFDGKPWRGHIDVVSGGFPCQDISAAGAGRGLDGERSGLWSEMARIIREVGPNHVLVENSPMLVSRGLGRVLGDLATMGYDARWGVLSAADAIWLGGTPCLDHLRERIWIVAHAQSLRRRAGRSRRSDSGPAWQLEQPLQDANVDRLWELQPEGRHIEERGRPSDGSQAHADVGGGRLGEPCEGEIQQPRGAQAQRRGWWSTEPDVVRMVHGVANGVDRIRCLGNGQVPAVVRLAWHLLSTPEYQGCRVGLPNKQIT